MSAHLPPEDLSDAAAVLVALTRLEAKIDVALARQAASIDKHADQLADHETRLRELEATPTVSPRTLWTTVASIIAAAAALYNFLPLA